MKNEWENTGVYLEGLKKITKTCQDSRFLGWDLKLGLLECEAKVLTTVQNVSSSNGLHRTKQFRMSVWINIKGSKRFRMCQFESASKARKVHDASSIQPQRLNSVRSYLSIFYIYILWHIRRFHSNITACCITMSLWHFHSNVTVPVA
jgi:hypothetical protein